MYTPGVEHRDRYEQMRRETDEVQTSYYIQHDREAKTGFASFAGFLTGEYEKVGPFPLSFVSEQGRFKQELYGIPLAVDYGVDLRDTSCGYVAFVANSQRLGIPLKAAALESISPLVTAVAASKIRVLMVQAATASDQRVRVVHSSLLDITDLVAYYDSPPNHRFIMASRGIAVPEGSAFLMKGRYAPPKEDRVGIHARLESIYNRSAIGDISDDALGHALFNEFME